MHNSTTYHGRLGLTQDRAIFAITRDRISAYANACKDEKTIKIAWSQFMKDGKAAGWRQSEWIFHVERFEHRWCPRLNYSKGWRKDVKGAAIAAVDFDKHGPDRISMAANS